MILPGTDDPMVRAMLQVDIDAILADGKTRKA